MVTFLVFSGVILSNMRKAKSGRPIEMRSIPAYDSLSEAIGRAVEMGKPVHFTPGKYEITVEMMAGLQALRFASSVVAKYDADMIVTTGRGDTYTVADAIVKETFSEAGKSDAYKPDMVRYLSDNQFAFASGVMGILSRERVAANIMIGQFAAESLLLSEAGYSVGAVQIAATAQVYQLPFFVAACDYVAIGEELFAADAYFTGNPVSLGCLRGQDIAKAISMSLIILGVILRTFGSDAILTLMKK